jgi:hypothetical protein
VTVCLKELLQGNLVAKDIEDRCPLTSAGVQSDRILSSPGGLSWELRPLGLSLAVRRRIIAQNRTHVNATFVFVDIGTVGWYLYLMAHGARKERLAT